VTRAPAPIAPPPSVGVIGPGRAGTGLALAWARAGYPVRLHGRRAKPVPEPLTLTVDPTEAPPPWLSEVAVVVLAVPDDAIPPLAAVLARGAGIRPAQVVLHLSGSLASDALSVLAGSGAGLGSLHPLQTLVQPELAPEHLRGAWAAVEGSARAVELAERLARDIGLRPFRLRAEDKARYHAGAVFASNYFVVVEAIAARLLHEAGVGKGDAWAALSPLVAGTLRNLDREGPRAALTGPVARGDADTLVRHLAQLDGMEGDLYRRLGAAALEIARQRGLDAATAARVARVLATDPPRAHP
jgi:predicted short-subunit dehydrogenase-like oxidoreductase (DUF2520 family)